jgi:N-carbamoyl-L-amino-acid hydrolase
MLRCKDALLGASRMVQEVNRIGLAHQPYACATVGLMQVSPNSRNTIPGKVFFTIDFRHPDDATLSKMDAEMRAATQAIADKIGLSLAIEQIWYSPPVVFNKDCVSAVAKGAATLGMPSMIERANA